MIDYIFYRQYKYHIRKNNPAILGGITFIFICSNLLSMPIIGNLAHLLGLKNEILKFYWFSYCLILLSILYFRFVFKKRYLSIIAKYDSKKSEKEVPLWVLELAYPICVIVGIGLWGGIYRFIIQEYSLEGKLGEWLFSLLN
jgi:hypothetical protein